jgi:hypothetical protein
MAERKVSSRLDIEGVAGRDSGYIFKSPPDAPLS